MRVMAYPRHELVKIVLIKEVSARESVSRQSFFEYSQVNCKNIIYFLFILRLFLPDNYTKILHKFRKNDEIVKFRFQLNVLFLISHSECIYMCLRQSEICYVRAYSERMFISLLVALNDPIKHIFVCISVRIFVLKYIATTLKLIKTFNL